MVCDNLFVKFDINVKLLETLFFQLLTTKEKKGPYLRTWDKDGERLKKVSSGFTCTNTTRAFDNKQKYHHKRLLLCS